MVIVTENKIKVTLLMMEDANMTRVGQLGVPVDPKDKNQGLRWKTWAQMEDADYDAIEEYFLNKKTQS